jgi:hypothetical protein
MYVLNFATHSITWSKPDFLQKARIASN